MPIFALRRLDDLDNRQIEFFGEFEVASVVTRHSHNRSGPVADKHIIGDPDRNLFLDDRVNGVRAGENAGLFFGQLGPLQIRFFGDLSFVSCNLSALLCRGDFIEKDHVSRAEQCIRPRGKDANRALAAGDLKIDFGAFAAANPIALHFF